MRASNVTGKFLCTLLTASAFVSGCAWIIGLDEFTDQPPPGSGGSGGGSVCAPDTVEPCYSGPPATEGVSECRAGSRICNPDGSAWGACEGEVLPTIERCDATTDENCDSLDCIVWAAAFEQTGTFEPSSIAADQEGNVFVSGSFTGTISIANQTFSSAGSTDGLLLKLSPDGQPLWAKKVGDILEDSIAALAPRPDGSLYIGGGTSSPVDFGGGVLPAGLYVAKLDADGGLVWSKGFGGRGAMASLAIDAQESVVAAGFFRDALDYGDGPIPAAGWYDIVVAKLDGMSGAITSPTGWVRTFGDPDFQFAYAVAVDSSSNIFVAGEVSGSVSFGGGAGTIQANGEDGFLLKITPGGAASWVRSQGGAGNQRARGVAVDSQGRPVVVGRFEGQIEVGSGTLPAAGTTDGFVLQLSTTGSILWGRAIGDASPQSLGLRRHRSGRRHPHRGARCWAGRPGRGSAAGCRRR